MRFLAIEAAAHGLVTVAHAAGGVVEAVAEGRSGRRLPPPHEAADFAGAVWGLIEAPSPTIGIKVLAMDFAWEIFGKRLTAVFSTVPRS